MEPLIITARMESGIAHVLPWSITLDGILAAQLWQQTKLSNSPVAPALDAANPPDMPLPLARCIQEDDWHWSATCAWPDPVPTSPAIHQWSGRMDHRAVGQLATNLPKTISDRQGRYRARMMPLPVTICQTLTWYAIGDPAAILGLLENVHAIGKKRSQGEGRVLDWNVEPAPLNEFTAAHLTPVGTLGRPSLPGCLAGHPDIRTGGTGPIAIRPPAMHRSRIRDLLLPAPWTAVA